MSKRKTTTEFIQEAKQIHGDKYDYSKVEYKNNKEKVCIICPIHGEFLKIAKEHLNGQGCPECSKINRGLKRRNTTEDFINKSKSIYGNKYDYSYTKYVDFYTPITIVCPIHGKFQQTPKQHYRGGGCPHCSLQKLTTKDIIERSIQIHKNKYDYSKVNYTNWKDKICIICHEKDENGIEHGEFWQTADSHIHGHGCPKCAGLAPLNTESFIEKASKIHNNKYDYSKVNYINYTTKVEVICPEHGSFFVTPTNHLRNRGCPICKQSQGEKEIIKYLNLHNIKYISQYEIDIPINISGKGLIDFYFPDYNLFIEYNGKQHYVPIKYFGGEDKFKKQKERDNYVREYATNNNIELIEIPYAVDNLEKCLNYIFNNMDNIKIVKQTLYTQWIDQSTGELFEETREFLDDTIKVPKKTSRSSKKPKDTDVDPKVYLEDNKIRLNNKAVELTGFEPEQKINVLFEKKNRSITPIICIDDKNGNRLTKTYTISCRGSRHENLEAYGTVFELIPYPDKEGYFKLKGNKELPEDDIIDIPEEINDPDKDEFEIDNLDIDDVDFTLDD